MTNQYELRGTYRKQDAVGLMQPFSADETADNAKEAMSLVRESLYQLGYDHILFKQVFENGIEISMMRALGLE